jgi:hypothetical protein
VPFAPRTVDIIAIAAAAGALVALLLVLAALTRARRLRRHLLVVDTDAGRQTLLAAMDEQMAEVRRMRQSLADAERRFEAIRRDLASALRHVAVVRYDAFGDMGGHLSFSAALLDESGNGVVLTSINGRSDTRTYAKGVREGASEQPLSPEEEQAIGLARGTRPLRTSS